MIWRAERRGREAGFTLIELIVVIAILGLVLALFVGRAAGPSRGLGLRAAANQLAAGLRETRAQAITADRPMELRLDLAHRVWRAADGAVTALPPTAAITLTTLAGEIQSANSGGIQFEPDGSSSGGRIALADGNAHIEIGIDWLTGRISVGDAH
jgi:general secretion pathway protein H